ncbi:MAG: DMT family transporter [Pseudomonadota bacterium]
MPGRATLAFSFVVLSLIWGYSWVFLKLGSYDSGPFFFAALRSLLGSSALLLALPLTGRRLLPNRFPELALLGLINTAGLVGCSQWALVEGSAARTSILFYTMPFWTLLLAGLLLNERMRTAQWIALAFAGLGLVTIVQPWALQGAVKSSLIAVAGAWFWAAGAVMIRWMHQRGAIDLLQIAGWQMAIGAMGLFGISALRAEPPVTWTNQFLIALTFTSFVSTGLGWLIWVYLLRHLTAGATGMTTLVIPVIAILSSAYHLGERLNASEITGVLLILTGLAILSIRTLRSKGTA